MILRAALNVLKKDTKALKPKKMLERDNTKPKIKEIDAFRRGN